MIVTDTNIITYLLLPTSYTAVVETLFQADCHWVAPMLWKSEFRNVLGLYIRKKIISLEKARQLQEQAELIMMDNEFEVPSTQVLNLINESGCSSYDCEFVALANHFNIKLITQDKKILKEFPSTAIKVSNYLKAKG